MADDATNRLDALLQIALRLARSSPSGRVALALVRRSIEPEWLLPWGEQILAQLNAALTTAGAPMPFTEVERVLRDSWGVPPGDELDELDPEPVTVTPVAQTHRGILDGEPVAVKVLRPGLATSVRQDLSLLESLAGPLGAAFPAIDPRAILAEVRERVLDDLDLEHEATVQRGFHRALRGHPLFCVPRPITRLAFDSVLVTEWIEGIPLSAAEDRDGPAALLVLFAAGATRWGTAHADLDPEKVLVLPDGRIAVVDFSATRTVESSRADLTTQMLDAFALADSEALASILERLGWLPATTAPSAEDLIRHALGELAGDTAALLDSATVLSVRDRLLERPDELLSMLLDGALPPEDLWPARGTAQLFGTIARIGATGQWRDLLRAGLRDGWEARLPG